MKYWFVFLNKLYVHEKTEFCFEERACGRNFMLHTAHTTEKIFKGVTSKLLTTMLNLSHVENRLQGKLSKKQ